MNSIATSVAQTNNTNVVDFGQKPVENGMPVAKEGVILNDYSGLHFSSGDGLLKTVVKSQMISIYLNLAEVVLKINNALPVKGGVASVASVASVVSVGVVGVGVDSLDTAKDAILNQENLIGKFLIKGIEFGLVFGVSKIVQPLLLDKIGIYNIEPFDEGGSVNWVLHKGVDYLVGSLTGQGLPQYAYDKGVGELSKTIVNGGFSLLNYAKSFWQ